MTSQWYDKVLIALLLASIVSGLTYALYHILYAVLVSYRRRRDSPVGLTKSISLCIQQIAGNTATITPASKSPATFESFGVYLGDFDALLPPSQESILRRWDTIILDPFACGVADAVSNRHTLTTSSRYLARFNLTTVLGDCPPQKLERHTMKAINDLAQTLSAALRRQQDRCTPFHGIVLAAWHNYFAPVVLNHLIRVLSSQGLAIYIEISPPCYLSDEECADLDFTAIKGMVVRNGTILSDGHQRNFFQMTRMLQAFRALARENPAAVKMLWDTIDTAEKIEYSVVKRSYNWCRYNSALSYIAPEAALTDADVALSSTVPGEPLGAFMWLKTNSVMEIQRIWKTNDHIYQGEIDHKNVLKAMVDFFPSVASTLCIQDIPNKSLETELSFPVEPFTWPPQCPEKLINPFSFSSQGEHYSKLGCFQLGLDADEKEHSDLTSSQQRLRGMSMLNQLQDKDIRDMKERLQCLMDLEGTKTLDAHVFDAVSDLLNLLDSAAGCEQDGIRIYIGLPSGFHNSTSSMWWGLYDTNYLNGQTDIFISAKTNDRTSTLLHTYLSSRNINRAQCFLAEVALAKRNGSLHKRWQLPLRIVNDVESLTSAELLLLLRRLSPSVAGDCQEFASRLRDMCRYQLMDVPTLLHQRTLNTSVYLQNDITAEDLILARLGWYVEQGVAGPDLETGLSLFKQVEERITAILMNRESEELTHFENLLSELVKEGKITVSIDLLALSVFCAFRKMAVAEVNLEVLDRNPLPNQHTDQAACFAEMFGTGSQCEAYFDTTSNVLGKILSDRQQAYYHIDQPPLRDDKSTELPTAYASMGVDLDPNAKALEIPFYYRITFLGIFALPALCDIMLLTTLGRGLYLSTYMTEDEKFMATTALMVSLLTTGAIGTWIGSGGSYYLHSMAYPAMNMFVITRFLAGTAICLASGLIAFIAIGAAHSFWAGFVFYAYFMLLSTYLTCLATLSIYQLPGFMFLSGRTTIITRIPLLFISPILTLFIGHDIIVYLCVLAGFVVSLLWGARSTIARWSTWYLHIYLVSDNQVAEWYVRSGNESRDKAAGVPEYVISAPRRALGLAVEQERALKPWQRSHAEPMVKKLAASYPATMFMLAWYTQYSRTKMPFAYSPTWNLQCKASIDTLKDMQKGLKLHNAFIHWRHAGDEVWCGVLYFVIALMDKWVMLFTGGQLVGLSLAGSSTYNLAVGFGLAYYLIAAVCLDGVAQPLWVNANKRINQPIQSMSALSEVLARDSAARARRYWHSLAKFFFLHVWGLAVSATLMWVFERYSLGAIMFLSYTGAYTGLLWYQYNRIFAGSLVSRDLIISGTVGLFVGLMLRGLLPHFDFGSVIGLASGTWTAATLSFFTARIGSSRMSVKINHESSRESVRYAVGTLGARSNLSQKSMADLYSSAENASSDDTFRITPDLHPGIEVMAILAQHTSSEKSSGTNLTGQICHEAIKLWSNGSLQVDLVGMREYLPTDQQYRCVSRKRGTQIDLFIFVGLELVNNDWVLDVRRNCKVIAEALIKTTAELGLGMSQLDSWVAEAQVISKDVTGVPEGVKRGLESSVDDRRRVLRNADKDILCGLLLGLDCDTEWEFLPGQVRSFLMQRACRESPSITSNQLDWVATRFGVQGFFAVQNLVHLSNEAAVLAVLVADYARSYDKKRPQFLDVIRPDSYYSFTDSRPSSSASSVKSTSKQPVVSAAPLGASQLALVKDVVRVHKHPVQATSSLLHSFVIFVKTTVKFVAVSLVADPELQRELDYLLRNWSVILSIPVRAVLQGIWLYTKVLQSLVIPLVFLHGRPNVAKLARNMKGMKSSIKKNRIAVDGFSGPSTCFTKRGTNGSIKLRQYAGKLDKEPELPLTLLAVNTYSSKLVLLTRKQYSKGIMTNEFEYDYSTKQTKVPISRRCVAGPLSGQIIQYDERGYMTCGSYLKDDNIVNFNLWYRKNAKHDGELLRAEYRLLNMAIRVSWCVPPPKGSKKKSSFVPFSKVVEATFINGDETYHAVWDYDHKFHPRIKTTLNGEECITPPMIEHDWFNVFTKPRSTNFLLDSPLFSFKSARASLIARLFGFNHRTTAISTARARSQLWKSWKDNKDLDAITARWLDEISLRRESTLRSYWLYRDLGMLRKAKHILESRYNTTVARVDVDAEISSWTPLAYKVSDLTTFGTGGDTRINTQSMSTQMWDTDEQLHVLAMDTGTWPNEGGGVSACRRDMVNDLKSIRWHVIAESANDFGVPKFQIERNVQSLSVLPLWGLDFLTPTHGIFEDYLDTYVEENSLNSTRIDIEKNFIPILKSLVRCSRALNFTREHIDEATKALVDLNTYFAAGRHWGDVWNSKLVKETWRQLWLSDDDDNMIPISQWLDAECPTELHLDQALDMWHRYLFIFSLPVPEEIPDVFQASHHFAGASYGVLCKVKRNCTLHVWDHCISWREVTVFLSSSMSFDPPFVCTSLISLSRMTSVLILHHADVVLPCADFFNPGWEIELGSQQNTICHRREFARKIDPVVNGICNMEKFTPIKEIKTAKPTATMLSHVRFVKDIKNAILAADIIVNEWGFKDYKLDVYGDMEKAPAYSVECQEIIASKKLREHVALRGLGSPSKVLEEAWIFLNSSVSEGLPLAMGEAALTGVPVVCTDVGASFRVVTDPVTWEKFSAVVAPNDALSLARAQVGILALLDEWAKFSDGDERPKMSYTPSREEVDMIQARMYEQRSARRRLGMMGRENVQSSFSSERYLREHEQMLWIGKDASPSYRAKSVRGTPAMSARSTMMLSKKFDEGRWSVMSSSNASSRIDLTLTP